MSQENYKSLNESSSFYNSFNNEIHMNYNIMKQIFDKNNICMMLDKIISPSDYVQKVINTMSNNKNSDLNIRSVIDKKDINIIDFLIKIGAKIKYISSGTTGHFFQGSIYDKPNDPKRKKICSFALKVSGYSKNSNYKSIYELTRPENAEINMLNILSEFVIENKTSHLILPIQTFYSDITPFIKMYKENFIKKESDKNGRYGEFVNRYEKGLIENKVSILICELANGGDFLKFVKNNKDKLSALHWNVLLFQVLSVLCVIQNKYPAFRHNDLKANNLLVEITDPDYENIKPNKYVNYRIYNKCYRVPDIGIIIKLWDFDFACIPKVCENIKVHESWTRRINITTAKNQYYDVHYFFRTLISNSFFPDIITSKNKKYEDIVKFIYSIMPKDFFKGDKVSRNGRILVNDEYTTPKIIIETSDYFKKFRID